MDNGLLPYGSDEHTCCESRVGNGALVPADAFVTIIHTYYAKEGISNEAGSPSAINSAIHRRTKRKNLNMMQRRCCVGDLKR